MLELDLNILEKKKGEFKSFKIDFTETTMSPPSLDSEVVLIKPCSFSVFFHLIKSASIALTAKKNRSHLDEIFGLLFIGPGRFD